MDQNAGEQANVQQEVLGASEDGSVVYFVATGKLGARGGSRQGQPVCRVRDGCVVVGAAAGGGAFRRR